MLNKIGINRNYINILKSLASVTILVIIFCVYVCKNKFLANTKINKCIKEGEVENVYKTLGRPYKLRGKIVHGREIGRTIGFPTANLEYDNNEILPKIGVYYTNVKIGYKIYKGITSVGNNPTVGEKSLTIETNILNFDKDIYDSTVEINFIKKIRDEKKFNNIEELKAQLNKDKIFAEKQELIY